MSAIEPALISWIFLLSAVFQRMRRFCTGQGGWYPIYLGGLCYRLQGP